MKVIPYLVMCALLSTPAIAATKVYKKSVKPATAKETVIDSSAIAVSDSEVTTFVFNKPIKSIVFPGTPPTADKPAYLADNTQAVIQFLPTKASVQMVVFYQDKSVSNYRIRPSSMQGRVQPLSASASTSKWVAASDKSDVLTASGTGNGVSANGDDIQLLKSLVATQQPPAGFEKVALPKPISFDLFTVVPIAAWSDDMSKRIMVFQLVANGNNTAVVNNTQFFRKGISAVMLDGDVVDTKTSPYLYVVEELTNE